MVWKHEKNGYKGLQRWKWKEEGLWIEQGTKNRLSKWRDNKAMTETVCDTWKRRQHRTIEFHGKDFAAKWPAHVYAVITAINTDNHLLKVTTIFIAIHFHYGFQIMVIGYIDSIMPLMISINYMLCLSVHFKSIIIYRNITTKSLWMSLVWMSLIIFVVIKCDV